MTAFIFILGGIFLRLLPHLPNFTPLSASALFGGSRLKKRYAFIIPFVAMIVSDYLLLYVNPFTQPMFNFSHLQPLTALFHATTFYVWGSFAISGLVGLWLRKNAKPSNILLASLLVSVQFYLITNFGVWATGMYSRGIEGLLQSYIMGLPFLRWTFLGDLTYTGVFFASYELASRVEGRVKKVVTAFS